MIKLTLTKVGRAVDDGKLFAIIHVYYDNHPLEGDGQLVVLEEGTTWQDSRPHVKVASE